SDSKSSVLAGEITRIITCHVCVCNTTNTQSNDLLTFNTFKLEFIIQTILLDRLYVRILIYSHFFTAIAGK
ncbi:MAG: hypothetical protein ACPGLV_13660, partial [Bacteroidia bacterium]